MVKLCVDDGVEEGNVRDRSNVVEDLMRKVDLQIWKRSGNLCSVC